MEKGVETDMDHTMTSKDSTVMRLTNYMKTCHSVTTSHMKQSAPNNGKESYGTHGSK